MTACPLRPLRDRIIVRPLDAHTGPILLACPEKPRRGLVVAVGPGARDKHGVSRPWGTRVGDVIQFADVLTYPAYRPLGATETLLVLSEADVMFVEAPSEWTPADGAVLPDHTPEGHRRFVAVCESSPDFMGGVNRAYDDAFSGAR